MTKRCQTVIFRAYAPVLLLTPRAKGKDGDTMGVAVFHKFWLTSCLSDSVAAETTEQEVELNQAQHNIANFFRK